MAEIKEELKEHGISHTTIEFETNLSKCDEEECKVELKNNTSHHHHYH
mgnify:CR=1 FL=1